MTVLFPHYVFIVNTKNLRNPSFVSINHSGRLPSRDIDSALNETLSHDGTHSYKLRKLAQVRACGKVITCTEALSSVANLCDRSTSTNKRTSEDCRYFISNSLRKAPQSDTIRVGECSRYSFGYPVISCTVTIMNYIYNFR